MRSPVDVPGIVALSVSCVPVLLLVVSVESCGMSSNFRDDSMTVVMFV